MSEVSILSDHRCELGEGPFFCERRNTLFWFDITGRKRHAHNFADNRQSTLELTEMASAMAVVDEQHDAILTSSGLWLHNIQSGAWSPIIDIEADSLSNRSNDARMHPSGAFWMGTMGLNAEDKAGAIYHFRKGKLSQIFDQISIPNAICFSPDGRTAYYTDTATDKLMSVAVDPDTGLPDSEPEKLIDHASNQGGLDGAIVDADGNIWIALWGASAVNCYAANGSLLKSIAMPALQCSCPAFVGGRNVVVTSAWQGFDAAARQKDPNAGMTFLVNADAKPKFEPRILL